MERVSSDSVNPTDGTPDQSGRPARSNRKASPGGPDPRDVVDGRDFADILMGSGRMDPEVSLPLPDERPVTDQEPASDSLRLENDPSLEVPDDQSSVLQSDKEVGPGDEQRDRAEVIGTSARWAAGWSLRFLVIAAGLWVAGFVASQLWAGILPLLLAIIVCTVLWPLTHQLRKWRVPNALAVLLTIIGFAGAFIGIIAAIAPSVSKQIPELVESGTQGVQTILDWVAGPPLNLQSDQLDNMLDQATSWLQDQSSQITQTAVTGVYAIT